jgi:hypothetical protein
MSSVSIHFSTRSPFLCAPVPPCELSHSHDPCSTPVSSLASAHLPLRALGALCVSLPIRVFRVIRGLSLPLASFAPRFFHHSFFRSNHNPSNHLPQKPPNYSPAPQDFAPRGELIAAFQNTSSDTTLDRPTTSRFPFCCTPRELFTTDRPRPGELFNPRLRAPLTVRFPLHFDQPRATIRPINSH